VLTPKRAVCGLIVLAACVVGGLVWVTVSALRIEQSERLSVNRADVSARERLALWRLDSHMLSPIGVENNRPFNNYSAVAPPALLVFDDSGFPKSDPGYVASPLLSAELPEWAVLHFQLDAATGWTSPQVLPQTLVANLQGEPLALPLSNCTPQRMAILDNLQKRLPIDRAILQFSKIDVDPESVPYEVPVLLADEPATAKSSGIEIPTDSTVQSSSEANPSLILNDLKTTNNLTEGTSQEQEKKNTANDPVSQSTSNLSNLAQRANSDAPIHPDAKARNSALQAATRGGNYEQQFNGRVQQQQQNPSGSNSGNLAGSGAGSAPASLPAVAGGLGAQNVAPPELLRNPNDWAKKQSTTIQNRLKAPNDLPVVKGQETVSAKKAEMPTVDFKKQSADQTTQSGLNRPAIGKLSGEGLELAATPKYPPIVAPVTVRFGPLRHRRLVAQDGTEYLFLVREATTETRILYQGILIDWPKLRSTLTNLIADLFPTGSLVSVSDRDEAPPERTMSALPVRLDTGVEAIFEEFGWTPLRTGLVIAWAAALLAIAAVAFGGRAIYTMSDRRVRFASAVTHELRTPLTALQLHLDLLTSGLITDEAKKAEYLSTISAEAERLNRLVENVLDFARLEKRSAVPNARLVVASELLTTIERTWTDRLRSEGFEFIAEADDPANVTFQADPRVLEQVLGNLIDNARKYAKSATDRRIWIRIRLDRPGSVAIEVEDRGPGIPASERFRIFQPFIRGSGANDTGGAGLGLSLAKEWAQLFGGSLSCQPALPTGACFHLILPQA
jgi:signal transduction histidine kinase